MMTTIAQVNEITRSIVAAKKMFTQSMANRVTTELNNIILGKKLTTLNKQDVAQIAEKLIINGNRSSVYTWLHWELFNRLIVKLRNKRIVECPFIINTASRRRRDLVFTFDRKVLADVPLVIEIANYLAIFTDCTGDPIVSPEVDMVCSFVASTILFSHVYFPSSYKSLLALKMRDVNIKHDFLNIPLKDEPVFYRHFLTSHSTLRLYRILRYYSCQAIITPEVRLQNDDTPLFPITFPHDSFPNLFIKWLTGVRQRATGHTTPTKLNLRSFAKAARCLALLDSSAQTDAHRVSVPCFIQAINARGISGYSFPDYFLSYLLKDYETGPYTPPAESGKGTYHFLNPALESIFMQIRKIRRDVYNSTDLTAKQRLQEIERIPLIISDAKSTFQPHDYINVKCFGEWFVTRYQAGTELKTINDYASMIPSIIDTLSIMNKQASEITDDDLAEVFKVLRQHYDSRGIKTRAKDYLEFVTAEYGSNISESVWKTAGTKIQERRTQKPFISYDHIASADKKVLPFLAARQVPSKVDAKITRKMTSSSLVHKALQMKHTYSLSFFTGLRREEVLSRKVSSIRYDDGPMLDIEKGKTPNAERSIPLFLLLPDDYLSQFMQLVRDREQKDGRDAYLFVQQSGKPWNSRDFIEDIQDVFISLGVPDYIFHNNRGSFVSWFILRWFKVFHREMVPLDTPFLSYELFHDKYDNRFKQLFWGHYECKDPFDFSPVNFVAARLLGHGGPVITQERYIHTTDWIYYLLLKHCATTRNTDISPSQAANLLQVSYSKIHRECKRLNITNITPAVLLGLQRDYLIG